MGCCASSTTDADGNKKQKAKFAAFKKELGQPLLLKHMDDLDDGTGNERLLSQRAVVIDVC
jgi:hypothetical protein